MMKKSKRVLAAKPEEVYQQIWSLETCEPSRAKGSRACQAAQMMLQQYCADMEDEELHLYMDGLERKTIYYTYLLNLLHSESEAAEQELLSRLRKEKP